jgi:ComF family protein
MGRFPRSWGFPRSWVDDLLAALLPSPCAVCGRMTAIEGERGVCLACWSGIELLTSPACPICGRPHAAFEDDDLAGIPCGGCASRPPPFEAGLSMGAYRGPLRSLIRLLKFEDRPDLAPPLAARAIAFLAARPVPLPGTDVVIPVPLGPLRRLQRGYNQSAEIARALSARLGAPCLPHALRRRTGGRPQARLPAGLRAANVRGAFRASRRAPLAGRAVLLVDDVWTTGATVRECTRALRAAGAARVVVFTLARAVDDFDASLQGGL